MSAQAATEPSMEDILASIRKIISEDGENQEPVTNSPLDNSASSADVVNAKPATAETDAATNSTENGDGAPQNPELIERRKSFDVAAASIGSLKPAPAPLVAPTSVIPPALLEGSQKPIGNAPIPGFVERKPQADLPVAADEVEKNGGQSGTNLIDTHSTSDALHPAIANAKEFVLKSEHQPAGEISGKSGEKPLFQNTEALNLPASSTPLVSPDNTERREDDERRNHPLRRGADRESGEFKQALMSPDTHEAVGDAFQQLKQSATENLDENVASLLRPMLREWLDDNLPSMVERLVRDEIERVSRGE